MKKFSIAPLLVVPFIACGSSDSHTVTTVDSHLGSGSGSGSGNVTCEAAASYSPGSAFGSANSFAVKQAGSGSNNVGHYDYFDGLLNGSDVLDITLYPGYGGFGSGDIVTGTFPLTGDDADYGLCGLCVDVMPGAFNGSAIDYSSAYTSTHQYIATTGSITLSSVSTRLTGSITGVTFKHFNIDGSGNVTNPDSCTTSIASASFDDAYATGSGSGSANFAATGTNGLKVQLRLRNRHQ